MDCTTSPPWRGHAALAKWLHSAPCTALAAAAGATTPLTLPQQPWRSAALQWQPCCGLPRAGASTTYARARTSAHGAAAQAVVACSAPQQGYDMWRDGPLRYLGYANEVRWWRMLWGNVCTVGLRCGGVLVLTCRPRWENL